MEVPYFMHDDTLCSGGGTSCYGGGTSRSSTWSVIYWRDVGYTTLTVGANLLMESTNRSSGWYVSYRLVCYMVMGGISMLWECTPHAGRWYLHTFEGIPYALVGGTSIMESGT